jgi:hypothetical protein
VKNPGQFLLKINTIPKRSGGARELAIPCVRDRVVHAALHELLSPALEAEFEPESYVRPLVDFRQTRRQGTAVTADRRP